MKSITTYITEKMVYTKNSVAKHKYHPKTKKELLSIISDKIKEEDWYHSVDMSEKIARIINTMHNHESLKPIFNGKKEIIDKIEGKK